MDVCSSGLEYMDLMAAAPGEFREFSVLAVLE